MKTLFTFFIGSLIATTSFAQYSRQASNNYAPTVTIAFNGTNMQVVIDGASYNAAGGFFGKNNTTVNVPNLQQGQHSLQVYRANRNSRQSQPLYSSSFFLRQGSNLTINVDNNGQVQMLERNNGNNNGGYNNGGYNNGNNNKKWNKNKRDRDRDNDGDNDDRDGRYDNRDGRYNNGNNNNGNGGYNNSNNPYNQNNRYHTAMADYNFTQILQSVKSKWFQSAKVNSVRDIFNNNAGNYFSTNQVSQLLSLINAESSRLELAKLSYPLIADPNSFSQLYSLFSNQSYRTDLENFVRSYRY